ncbi:HYC_CC_PP family protein [Sanyastnella coralliicola]|uniref:HYC_CC_PP family protein n=1 Tax=Sanyastnella coralliicola TaxID=3069118 RepID=UPI003D9C7C28
MLLLLQVATTSITVHYCGGKLRSTSINTDRQHCVCDHEVSPSALGTFSPQCCSFSTTLLEDYPAFIDSPSIDDVDLGAFSFKIRWYRFFDRANEITKHEIRFVRPPTLRRYLVFGCQKISPAPMS